MGNAIAVRLINSFSYLKSAKVKYKDIKSPNSALSFSAYFTVSMLIFLLALFVQHISGSYADSFVAPAVPDIFHDNVPVVNVLPVWIALHYLMVFFTILYPLLFKTKEFPYIINAISLFVLVRSFSVILTHLGAPDPRIDEVGLFGEKFFYQDFFPSGHVGVPFIVFLLYRDRILKALLLFISIGLAICTLLMHTHYSIDVFASFFVSYGIYRIWCPVGKAIDSKVFSQHNQYDSERR